MLGKRTKNALVRSFFKIKTAKGLKGYLDKIQKKGGDELDRQSLLASVEIAGIEALHEQVPTLKELTTCILHQNCLVGWDSLSDLIEKINTIDEKEAQKKFRDLHCAKVDKFI